MFYVGWNLLLKNLEIKKDHQKINQKIVKKKSKNDARDFALLPTVDNGRDISNEIDSDTSPSKNSFHEDDEFNDESYDVIKVGEEAKVNLTVENATIDDTEDILDAQDIPISEISEVIPKQNTSSFDDDDEVIEDIECSKNSNNSQPNALHEPKIADEHLKEALFQHQQDLNKAVSPNKATGKDANDIIIKPNKPRPKSGRPRKQTKQTITKTKNDSIMPANRKRQSEDKLKNITKKTKNDEVAAAVRDTLECPICLNFMRGHINQVL